MTPPEDNDPIGQGAADIRRQFDALIAGMGLDDLTSVAHMLMRPQQQERPDLRRPPLPERSIFRLRVSLDGSEPQIWRLLEVHSDLTLDVVHRVLQSAFDWWDYHLNRFALGGDPWDRTSQVFACKEDLAESDLDDEPILDSSVRLDETLQQPGEVLRYVYDYGDDWHLTIRLEEVLDCPPDTPSAICTGGERAAPPEDCGHLVTAEELAEVVDDPAYFDLDEVNHALQSSFVGLAELGIRPELADLVSRLRLTDVGEDLTARALELATSRPAPSADEWRAALRAHQWLLDRAEGEGIALTNAGYLPPADVVTLAPLVPAAADWLGYGKNNRENMLIPLLEFRQSLQKLGLLRKSKGRLLLTKAGGKARGDVAVLRRHIADRLGTFDDDRWTSQATLLILLYAATSAEKELPLGDIARALRHFGWRDDRGPIQAHHLYDVAALDILRNVSPEPVDYKTRNRISKEAAMLARAALTLDFGEA